MKKFIAFGLIVMFLLVNTAVYGAYSSPAEKKDKDKKKDDPTVYIKEKGKKYHKKNCKIVKEGKIGIKLSEAIKKGYEPCAVCKPPTKPDKKKDSKKK
jgi:hypothetical protein